MTQRFLFGSSSIFQGKSCQSISLKAVGFRTKCFDNTKEIGQVVYPYSYFLLIGSHILYCIHEYLLHFLNHIKLKMGMFQS